MTILSVSFTCYNGEICFVTAGYKLSVKVHHDQACILFLEHKRKARGERQWETQHKTTRKWREMKKESNKKEMSGGGVSPVNGEARQVHCGCGCTRHGPKSGWRWQGLWRAAGQPWLWPRNCATGLLSCPDGSFPPPPPGKDSSQMGHTQTYTQTDIHIHTNT